MLVHAHHALRLLLLEVLSSRHRPLELLQMVAQRGAVRELFVLVEAAQQTVLIVVVVIGFFTETNCWLLFVVSLLLKDVL